MLGRIFGGLLMIAGGAALCYYSYQLVKIFGRNARMESNGGTRGWIVICGFVLMVLGVLVMFGVLEISNPTDQVAGVGI